MKNLNGRHKATISNAYTTPRGDRLIVRLIVEVNGEEEAVYNNFYSLNKMGTKKRFGTFLHQVYGTDMDIQSYLSNPKVLIGTKLFATIELSFSRAERKPYWGGMHVSPRGE